MSEDYRQIHVAAGGIDIGRGGGVATRLCGVDCAPRAVDLHFLKETQNVKDGSAQRDGANLLLDRIQRE